MLLHHTKGISVISSNQASIKAQLSLNSLFIPSFTFSTSPPNLSLPTQLQRSTEAMASQTIETHREKAEVYTDPSLCKQKSLQLLEELSLPKGLLPLDDMVEVGYNRDAGFVWLRQKKSKTHLFSKIGKNVSYAAEVTAFVEKGKLKKLTGVKSKELLIWVSLTEICINDSTPDKITFTTPAGLYRSYPVSAFELVEELKK